MSAFVKLSSKNCRLTSATAMPNASGFLWNQQMLLNMNCRGYASSIYMEPEPAKYSFAPNIEATTFLQPEHPYFSHHPGRFFYIKDEDTGELFSAPYEPVRNKQATFEVIYTAEQIKWCIELNGVEIELVVSLSCDDCVELWQCTITNNTAQIKNLSIYPYFTVGYMSWMNQSGRFDEALNGIVCQSISPYQKVEDYDKFNEKKDVSFLLCETMPDSWETNQRAFEGEGGLHAPSALEQDELSKKACLYETPVAAVHYKLELKPQQNERLRFVFGAARHNDDVKQKQQRYFGNAQQFDTEITQYRQYVHGGLKSLTVTSKNETIDNFINHWLPRQVFYHGDVNRLTTDPQTRNYLQDALGILYISPEKTKQAIIKTCEQQSITGQVPDGILLHPKATLKYINQVPHTDHNVWLVITLLAYLDETNDYALLEDEVKYGDSAKIETVFEHVNRALNCLISSVDHRGLSFIQRGDWCDPMNMVGHKGKGVSSWLSLASAYVLDLWANFCASLSQEHLSEHYQIQADILNKAVVEHCWDEEWIGRGITDDNVLFGIKSDPEGSIYLNPQSWAFLSGAVDQQQQSMMINQIEQRLKTPYGFMMLAPAYTKMRDDVGRVTQKFPGSAENGSVYNHAAIFYAYSLYQINENDRAYQVLESMLPSTDDCLQRGQLPLFIPNYYRGAYFQHPEMAGKSSGLFNTGTAAWYLRCVIEELYGLKGCPAGLKIAPKFPSDWQSASITRLFRGATFHVSYQRVAHSAIEEGNEGSMLSLTVNGTTQSDNVIAISDTCREYHVKVVFP